jgi:uncharacterized damage-inducible protein DinB
MLDQAIQGVDEENWVKEVNGWTYADVIYHIIITQEFYIRDTPKGMKWGTLYGDPKDKNQSPRDYYPDKNTLIQYRKEVEQAVRKYLESMSDMDLVKSDGFKDHLSSIHKKLLYLLRHNAHHLGELTLMHRTMNLDRVKWV